MTFTLTLLMVGPAAARPVIPKTDEIRLTTRTSHAGPHPVLAWKRVADATHYALFVQTPDGDPYWTWQGTQTRVRFGGGPLDAPDKTEGAELVDKLVWFVLAYDDAGGLVASSAKRKISR